MMSLSAQEKITRIMRHLGALDELRNPVIRQMKAHRVCLSLSALPEHPAILRREKAEDGSALPVMLRVSKAAAPCPEPPSLLEGWLDKGWELLDDKPKAKDEIEVTRQNGVVQRVFLHDDPERLNALENWMKIRDQWSLTERAALLFHDQIEEIYSEISKEGESVELLLGQAILDEEDNKIQHPVLLFGAALEFLPEESAYRISRLDEAPQLYAPLIRTLKEVNETRLNVFIQELQNVPPDLLDATQMQPLVQSLSEALAVPLSSQTVLLLRRRTLGYAHAVQVIENEIANGALIPPALLRVVGLEADEETTPTTDEDALLLSKAANEEQLRIARSLGRSSAVLVQGPPGTGKTHTIANLLGHLLAEGKSVLVTSHTSKALRVLRDIVEEPLRPLCLSVLDNEVDNHAQLDAAVQTITARLSASDAESLQREAASLEARRQQILSQIKKQRQTLLEARFQEMQEITACGEMLTSSKAAKLVGAGLGVHDWLPCSVTPMTSPPLTQEELVELYETNTKLTAEDELTLRTPLPDATKVPSSSELAGLMAEKNRLQSAAEQDRPELWLPTEKPAALTSFDTLLPRIRTAANKVRDADGWWLEVLRAGRQGGLTRQVWDDLAARIEAISRQSDEAQALLHTHVPEIIPSSEPLPKEDKETLQEILTYLQTGGSLGFWTKTTKREWHRLIDRTKVSGKPPEFTEHFEALLALAKLTEARNALLARWTRQVSASGGPEANTLGQQPERTALAIAGDIRTRLDWDVKIWQPLHAELLTLGFQWEAYASGIASGRSEYGDIPRLRMALTSGLEDLVHAHRDALRYAEIQSSLSEMTGPLQLSTNPVARRMVAAIDNNDVSAYADAARSLMSLDRLQGTALRRSELLTRLADSAAPWAKLVQNRTAPHDAAKAPGDLHAAWQWRQLHDALESLSQISLQDTQSGIEALNRELHSLTSQLVERKAWAAKKQSVDARQQAALEGYVNCLQKMTKSGKGKRDAALANAAREHLQTARRAVPVWIMPLSRVYESFFPKEGTTRFDVVIIDEASQSDVSALAALYLGEKVIIVGDEEQVTPIPFANLDEVQRLISTHLEGIPNSELYDPETSIYHLARTFFKERIMLREHFRSVPEIIAFSNDLSYERKIKPLRESASSSLKPALIPHRVKGGSKDGKINADEAEEIASLILACLEQPEYQTNDQGEPTTFGVISLLGDEQAVLIESLLRARLSAEDFEKRRVICGNASQFQGDERDVMFISLVDVGEGTALPMRGFGPRELFRKRFNVAASRARNQMWIVHSLDPTLELQTGDLRRRLIEHATNPATLMTRADSVTPLTTLQSAVQDYLLQRGYQVATHWPVGSLPISLVAHNGKRHLAIECDGDRTLSREELEHDMARIQMLERIGWNFARVRASEFYRNAEQSMTPVLKALDQAGVMPTTSSSTSNPSASEVDVLDRVRRRLPEIKWIWSQRTKPRTEPKSEPQNETSPAPLPVAAVLEPVPPLVNGTTHTILSKTLEIKPLPALAKTLVSEVGDWVTFVLVAAPKDMQVANIIEGPTDVDQSTVNVSEPLAKALLGRAMHERTMLIFGDVQHELEVMDIRKPRKKG